MMPRREVLARLIKSNTSFVLYGQKASGKTTLIHDLFKETETNFLEINCTLANKKSNFLKLFNVELNKFLKSRDLSYNQSSTAPVNLDSWINEIKRIVRDFESTVQYLNNLYIFMDNIEEMNISQHFLPSFYAACQKEFSFKFSFIFCGVNFLKKQYCLELPFRTMISFCMPSPEEEFTQVIYQTAEQAIRENIKQKTITQQCMDKCLKTFTSQIKHGFENIDKNLEKMKAVTKSIVDLALQQIQDKDLSKGLTRLVNIGDLSKIMSQVREEGPVLDSLGKRKFQDQNPDVNPNLQYYPNLILTSVHLADYYNEKQDKRRFYDYKNRTAGKNKDLKKCDFKVGKHNINRIIAIADSLESQAKQNDKELKLEHHSLDFFAQFQHLRRMNRIKYYGNKMTGIVKEEEAKAFMSKIGLSYSQFMA